MSTINFGATHLSTSPSVAALSRFEKWLPTLLSVIAGMVDLTGFLSLGNLFTAHITGNLVVIGALVVRRGRINPAQILAIPVFILAVAATWLLARASGRRGPGLRRLLLLVQFLLLACVLIFSVITKPSSHPHGLMAGIAAMMAVSAMACQFALLRLALPAAPSTAVMTGNLTNIVLSLMDRHSRIQPMMAGRHRATKKLPPPPHRLFRGMRCGRCGSLDAGRLGLVTSGRASRRGRHVAIGRRGSNTHQ
jgi:uncharacterized membrane protein YoaK (UPF0700 family)